MNFFKKSCLLIAVTFASNHLGLARDFPDDTVKNLNSAYQNEANAVNRYQLYAERAKQEGYPQVEKLFHALAQSESIHRENYRQALHSLGKQPPQVKLETIVVRSTRENLDEPTKSEAKETAKVYPKYIQQAEKDHVDPAIRAFIYSRDSEAEHLTLVNKARQQLNHSLNEKYYVGKITGHTIAVASQETPNPPRGEPYIHIG